ncbi:MAG: endonuclease/exonuclease/phosphatase (EEP) superfamily protein YafD [Cognaticolwellia sp.]|jgi:endonuclease/exonuclease/phosphatase (EEP) superfamily protein YafD
MFATVKSSEWAAVLLFYARAAGVLLVVACVVSSLGQVHWPLELLTHWMPQIAGASLLCTLVLLAMGDWLPTAVLGGLTAIVGLQVAPWMGWGASPEKSPAAFSVFYANVLRANKSTERLSAQITEADADVVVLVEVDRRWLSELEPVLGAYPESLEHPQDDNFGVAFYSRLPVESLDTSYFGPDHAFEGPGVVATVLVDGRPVQIYGIHTLPPAAGDFAEHRDLQLQDLAERVADMDHGVVVVGDLNTSMYASGYKRLAAQAGLSNARKGRGPLGTWPAGFPGWLRIPIDHIMFNEQLRVTHLEVGEQMGSDHRALYAEVAFAEALEL